MSAVPLANFIPVLVHGFVEGENPSLISTTKHENDLIDRELFGVDSSRRGPRETVITGNPELIGENDMGTTVNEYSILKNVTSENIAASDSQLRGQTVNENLM